MHGDIHHGNILDFGDRGWLAIDPKGLYGERIFDYANIFCNPDFITVTNPGRFERQLKIVSELATIAPSQLIKWVIAYAGLSSAWHLEDGTDPSISLAIVEKALALNC